MLQPRQSAPTSTPWVFSGVATTLQVSIDPNGNLTADGTKTFEWDAVNRLLAVKQGGSTLASFTYDGGGRRSTKAAAGITTTYVYDGGAQFLEERPSVGSTRRYVYGPGIDQAFAQVVSGVTSYNVADHLGSVVRTTDSTGVPSLTREYDPWGNLLQGSATGGYAFTGREWDAETGLHYYRARYFDAHAARFLSEDPIGLEGGVNFYRYVVNRPTSLVDPYGLQTVVFITSDHGIDSHSAVYVTNAKDPILYDPSGNVYRYGRRPANDIFYGDEANVSAYVRELEAQRSVVTTYHFCTTPEEEAQIARRIETMPRSGIADCALHVSKAITRIGPFKDVGVSWTPGGLRSDLEQLFH